MKQHQRPNFELGLVGAEALPVQHPWHSGHSCRMVLSHCSCCCFVSAWMKPWLDGTIVCMKAWYNLNFSVLFANLFRLFLLLSNLLLENDEPARVLLSLVNSDRLA